MCIRDRPGKAQARGRLQAQAAVQQLRRVEEGVAMQAAEAREFRLSETRDHAEDAHLFGVLQLGLEADHVVERAQRIVLPQLHHCIGLDRRIVRIGEPHRLHRACLLYTSRCV